MRKIPYFFLFVMGTLSWVKATQFAPISLERQLTESDGVIWGKFNGQSYKKVDHEVVTVASFEVLKYSGIGPNRMINKQDFKVLYPGGMWQNQVHVVEGAPRFRKGEEVLLILKDSKLGFIPESLSLSKYYVLNEDGNVIFKSSVFPRHSELGRINKKKLNKLLEYKFGEGLKSTNKKVFVYKSEKNDHVAVQSKRKKSRAPASISKYKEEKVGVNGLILILAIIGAFHIFLTKKREE